MSGRAQIGAAGASWRTTSDELEGALRGILDVGATPVKIADRSPLPCRSTFPIEKLVVRLADGGRRRLVFKDLSCHGAADPGWRVKARFVHDPQREIDCYRHVLDPGGITAPPFVGATVQPGRNRYWLFLEYCDGEPLWQIGDLQVWCRAARWLARLHARFRGRTGVLPRRLLRLDPAHWRRWLERALRLGMSAGPARCTRRQIQLVGERYERAARAIAGMPATFLHGEFYPSNILVDQRAARPRILPLDWEMAAVGPGVLDLAALTSGGWEPAERRALAEAYRAALPRCRRPSAASLRRDLDRCRLLLAVRWLGWSPRWTPPPEHAHDWLTAALELARGGEAPPPLREVGG